MEKHEMTNTPSGGQMCPQCGSRDEAASELCSNRWHQSIHDLVNAVEAADAKVRRYDSMGMHDEIGMWIRWADYDAEVRAGQLLRKGLANLIDSQDTELTTLRAKLAEAHGLIRRARYYVVKHGGTGGTDLQIDIDAALQQGSTKGE